MPALAQAPPTDEVERGAYLARAGDCVACHTAPGGADMAGGLPMKMPFGTIYSTNITPGSGDRDRRYQPGGFRAGGAQGHGKPDGRHLYPAMPYPSFAKLTEADLRALYAYFMNGVPPVHHPNRKNGVPWPLDVRWPLALWDAAFTGKRRFQPDPPSDADWNRGAYLVEGPDIAALAIRHAASAIRKRRSTIAATSSSPAARCSTAGRRPVSAVSRGPGWPDGAAG
jgi:mono/diheme cytochrome c family protein